MIYLHVRAMQKTSSKPRFTEKSDSNVVLHGIPAEGKTRSDAKIHLEESFGGTRAARVWSIVSSPL